MTGVIAVIAGLSLGLMMTREGREPPGVYVIGAVVIASLALGAVLELRT